MEYGGTARPSETLGSKLRRLSARAKVSNEVTNVPLITPAAWVASTDYTGQEGLVVKNGTNMYKLYLGGLAAGAGGPTGTNEQVFSVDNACRWVYIGSVVNPAASSVDIPVITSFNGAGALANHVDASTDPNLQQVKLEAGTYYLQDGTHYVCVATTNGVNKTGNIVTGSGGTQGLSSTVFRLTIMTDDPLVDFTFEYPKNVRVFVDDVPLWRGTRLLGSGSGVCGFQLDWTGSTSRKVRKITIETVFCNFRKVGYGTYGSLMRVQQDDDVYCTILSDSWGAGGNNMPWDPGGYAARIACKLLGWNDVTSSGIGGTGVVNAGSYVNYQSRALTDALGIGVVVPAGFTQAGTFKTRNVIIIQESINDAANGTVGTSTLTLYNLLRSNGYAGVIIVVGMAQSSNMGAGVGATSDGVIKTALSTALATDPLLFWIPVSATDTDNPSAWFTGTGHTGIGGSSSSLVAAGNNTVMMSDDGNHLNETTGILYYGFQLAAAIRRRVLPYLN